MNLIRLKCIHIDWDNSGQPIMPCWAKFGRIDMVRLVHNVVYFKLYSAVHMLDGSVNGIGGGGDVSAP